MEFPQTDDSKVTTRDIGLVRLMIDDRLGETVARTLTDEVIKQVVALVEMNYRQKLATEEAAAAEKAAAAKRRAEAKGSPEGLKYLERFEVPGQMAIGS